MSSLALDMESLLATFFEEAEEHLVALEGGLLELETRPDDREVLGRIFRAAHSIKGASGTFGLTDVMTFTHALETVLDKLRNGELAVTGPVAKVLLASLDVLRNLVHAARANEPAPSEAAQVRRDLEALLADAAPAAPAVLAPAPGAGASGGARVLHVTLTPNPEFMSAGLDPIGLLRDLAAAGTVRTATLDTSRVPPLAALDPESMFLAWEVTLETEQSDADLADIFVFAEGLAMVTIREIVESPPPEAAAVDDAASAPVPEASAPTPAAGRATPAAAAATIRVATDKVDKLLDLVGEIVIAQAMIAEAARSIREDAVSGRFNDALSAMDRHTRELQERVMSIRMIPLGTVFARLPRMVRDVAAAVEKEVRLVVEGEGTEIDKSMVEQLVDPLMHLVRNAIDHGLERPHEREAAGKSREGAVTLRAFHQGGNVVIDVEDDGRGLDVNAIRAKAIKSGLLDEGTTLSDDAIFDFIFHPGFSTAATVSNISGRGVGMDVVKRNVEALNGSLSLSTVRGSGTRMRLRLPLTLAILDGLAVRIGKETFILPLLSVVESFRPAPNQVRWMLGAPEVVDVRTSSLPIARLYETLGVEGAEPDPSRALVCIVETNGGRIAALVDEVLGQLQVVVKSLDLNYRKVSVLTGATILGDGRVAMILDVQALGRGAAAANDTHAPRATTTTSSAPAPATKNEVPR